MFFFIGGISPRTVRLDEEARPCHACGRRSCRPQRVDQYLSLFFIPIVRIKKGEPYWSCTKCGVVGDETRIRRIGGAPFPGSASVCRTCGRRMEFDFKFCPHCGMRTD